MPEIQLSTEEIQYLIMSWDAMKHLRHDTYKRHAGVATMVRLRLENALDYGHMREDKQR